MAWDAKRPIPWKRLWREFAFLLVVMGIIITLFSSTRNVGTYVAVALGGLVYVAFGAILAKFGYQRQTLKTAREAREARDAMRAKKAANDPGAAAYARSRPAPTRRTSTGPSQRPNRNNKAKRR